MKKEIISIIIVVIAICLANTACYHAGYENCEKHYNNYYNATETMLDSIDSDYMLDVVMEGDAYQDYIKAKEDLK